MTVIERAISVSYRHRIFFTRHVFQSANPVLRDVIVNGELSKDHKILFVVDEALAQSQPDLVGAIESYAVAHADTLRLVCKPFVVEGGEGTKSSFVHVSEIHQLVDQHHIDRHSYLIAVGGGALLDMAGLAAATAHRGLRHIRIPSTTLSQDDSGVGVKNGINAYGKKNFIGTFSPPFAVINDFELLKSLKPHDRRAGFVEAVKVSLIRDRQFFESIERDAERLASFDPPAVESLIFRCAELHANHIATSGDPFEFGSARPLDFGHWSAHKMEQMSGYDLRHGEAVAIGIALDVVYCENMGFIDRKTSERILSLLNDLGFDLFAEELLRTDPQGNLSVLSGLEEFREHLGGQLTITLIHGIGLGFEVHEMDRSKIRQAIEELQRYSRIKQPLGKSGAQAARIQSVANT